MLFLGLLVAVLATRGESRKFVNITGDIVIGALFPIHRKGAGAESCGKIQIEEGIQPLETMLYTLGQINRDPSILPGVRLGVLAFDSCNDPNYALEQALNFVKGFIAHTNEYHRTEFRCSDGSTPKFLGGSFDKVVAVLAAQSSSVTLQVASMLRLFQVPQISYMATTPSLSSRERFPHFFRTVPSDLNQAHAMLAILKQFEWTYSSVVYSTSEYGKRGFETLMALAGSYSVCFSAPQRIIEESFTSEDYDNVVRTISNKTEVRVIVLFAEKATTLRVMDAARRLGVGARYVWIGSDAWSTGNHRNFMNPGRHMKDHEEVVLEGALAVQPLSRQMSGFDEYFTDLGLDHQLMNPWYREFWHEYHHCGPGADVNDNNNETSSVSSACSNESSALRIDPESGYKQYKFVHFVRDAVYSVAHALHDLFVDRCGPGHQGMCPAMQHIDGDVLSRYLANVSFKDEAGNKFRFVDGVDGPPRYSILNYQKGDDGSYRWQLVGNYTQDENGTPRLNLESDKIRYRSKVGTRFPKSTCAAPCPSHQVKIREKQDPCCGCYSIVEEFIDYSSPWSVTAMAVATCGILLTIFVLCVFWLYSETPVIKASGRELSSLLLLGTLASFLMTFAIIARPNTQTCAITRFGIGLCYTLCYAALVTKTNRIHRIFNNATNSPHKPRYTSPRSQLVITSFLTFIEVLINGAWLMKAPPSATYTFPTRDTRLRICQGFDDRSYMIGLIYPFILIVICTIYAVKTRKCPEGFNETRYIAFTNYTTLVLWLAFVPLYLASTSNAIRVVTLALSLSLSASVQLGCLFFPKVYIVLMKPEKNTKELVMTQHRSSSYLPTPATPVVVLNSGPYVNNGGGSK